MQRSPSPERQVRKRLSELKELVTFRPSEGNFAVLARLQQLGGLLTADAELRLDAAGLQRGTLKGRDEITQMAAAMARQSSGEYRVDFLDVVVIMHSADRAATVRITVKVHERATDELWVQPFRIEFVRTPDGWQIASATTERPLT
jgi:hypothetical protein